MERGTVRLTAAACRAVRPVLAAPVRQAAWLGASATALYLRTAGQPGALAVLAHDAVRLPCGLLLATTAAELPLTSLVAGPDQDRTACLVGCGMLTWSGPAGPVVIRVVREWSPARAAGGVVVGSALAQVRASLPGNAAAGLDGRLLAELGAASTHDAAVAVVARLLGHGPGLTPSGDDVLAGFLIGAGAFGLDAAAVRAAIAGLAPARTTALSAALLWHAARGECIDEVAAVAAALTGCGPAEAAIRRLLAVGHTSGVALAAGLVAAAAPALRRAAGLAWPAPVAGWPVAAGAIREAG